MTPNNGNTKYRESNAPSGAFRKYSDAIESSRKTDGVFDSMPIYEHETLGHFALHFNPDAGIGETAGRWVRVWLKEVR